MISGERYTVNSDRSLGEFLQRVTELHQSSGWVKYTWATGKQRSNNQNSAMWMYFTHVAETLNELQLSCYMDCKGFESPIEVDWTKELVSKMWLAVQEVVAPETGTSTRLCPKDKVSTVFQLVHRKLVDITDGKCNVGFPSKEDYPEKVKQ
tara:strand:- start:1210 stop:1662 length:453 start_codon:yes stop_codon:yes gene_type:complete